MKRGLLSVLTLAMVMASCSNDDDNIDSGTIETPLTYDFSREGNSTVDFNGQTTRILMAEELASALLDPTQTAESLEGMFTHAEGGNDFEDASLNASGKNIYSKTAASRDFFSANTTLSNEIKADFSSWLADQANLVFPNWEQTAAAGVAGQIQESGGGSVRYVNGKGLELNQAFIKSLIGGLMVDQMLNNYLSSSVLDESTNVEDNNNGVTAEGKSYTVMEHKWDEAYGYLYGLESDPSMPALGADSYLNKYLARVENDEDYAGIAADVFNAFALGRAAIVEKDYALRDEQAEIIRELISKVIAIRAVYYLQTGKNMLEQGDYAAAFHDLSEGFGFIYSLQFTRQPGTVSPYFSNAEVNDYIAQLLAGDGFWDVSAETLDTISQEIADRFGLVVEETL
ncbi:DUF4856 domain-containing protein [Robertkochia aurantiaca]|uniref:DUF4856 domain-containing protein n=1 Tax=Robertkochia aurantiaca TaxID=2873700 RepID=UPI001CD0080E|nr:DUF4856 domain-containing protein [Robertkochia sp. 3YJGBD-33]